MAYNPKIWNRLEYDGVPFYARRDRPDWFVPNKRGDQILGNADVSHGLNIDVDLAIKRFLDRLPDAEALEYPGRASLLKTEYPRELRFHITNRCNMTCTHCLFLSGPEEKTELSVEGIFAIAGEADDLSCRVFARLWGFAGRPWGSELPPA